MSDRRRRDKSADATKRAGWNDKAALANFTVAGGSVAGGLVGVGTIGLAAGLSGLGHAKEARRLRGEASATNARSKALAGLDNKRETGNTLGVRGVSPVQAKQFAEASHTFNTSRATEKPGNDGGGVAEGRRGFGNPNNQQAAQKARAAKGFR